MAVVMIEHNALIVEIEEVKESRPISPVALEPLPDINGTLIVYERAALREIPVVGRIKTKAEVERLEDFLIETDLTVTERDGTASSGWRVRTDPPPQLRRKDGDSADWEVSLKLWRLP